MTRAVGQRKSCIAHVRLWQLMMMSHSWSISSTITFRIKWDMCSNRTTGISCVMCLSRDLWADFLSCRLMLRYCSRRMIEDVAWFIMTSWSRMLWNCPTWKKRELRWMSLCWKGAKWSMDWRKWILNEKSTFNRPELLSLNNRRLGWWNKGSFQGGSFTS
jgi:hypothetical protein